MEEDAGIPATGAALPAAPQKVWVFWGVWEFHHLLPGGCRCILFPGSRRNGGFVRFYGEFGSLGV